VRVQSDTDLITFENWTVRVRAAQATPARLLLLIHGWTGDENSMWVFTRNFAEDYSILAPRAPHAAEPFGYSWRAPRADYEGRPSLDDLQPAADALIWLIDAYARENKINATQFDAIGFSQGAAVVNAIGILYPNRIRRAGVLAGFMPSIAESIVVQRPLSGKPFFVAHGTLDETVKFEYARKSVEVLEQAGARVTFCEDQVGHKVGAHCLRALEEFFV
jgi:phospholipase/carboxylesterase